MTLRSISNFISDDGTRDGAYGHKDDFGGDIFQKYDLYWDRSPLKYVQNVTTPILILHSDNDYRVPIEQGEQWFRALKHFGKTAEIVFFPRENHNLTRTGEPKHLVESIELAALLVRQVSRREDRSRRAGLALISRRTMQLLNAETRRRRGTDRGRHRVPSRNEPDVL